MDRFKNWIIKAKAVFILKRETVLYCKKKKEVSFAGLFAPKVLPKVL